MIEKLDILTVVTQVAAFGQHGSIRHACEGALSLESYSMHLTFSTVSQDRDTINCYPTSCMPDYLIM